MIPVARHESSTQTPESCARSPEPFVGAGRSLKPANQSPGRQPGRQRRQPLYPITGGIPCFQPARQRAHPAVAPTVQHFGHPRRGNVIRAIAVHPRHVIERDVVRLRSRSLSRSSSHGVPRHSRVAGSRAAGAHLEHRWRRFQLQCALPSAHPNTRQPDHARSRGHASARALYKSNACSAGSLFAWIDSEAFCTTVDSR